MAYVYHEALTSSYYPIAHDGLTKWNQWGSIDTNVFYTLAGTEYVWDIYYSTVGTQGFVGIAVPAYDASPSEEHPVIHRDNTCYIVRKDTEGNLTFYSDSHIVISSGQILTVVVTNTVAYIGVRDTESADPHGIFATVVVSQANSEMTEVAVGFNNITVSTLYDANQSTKADESISALWYNFPYTILVPLAGLNYGVASGIYRFIYNEFQASNSPFQNMVLHNKTFYVDDNIAIIDYFTGF